MKPWYFLVVVVISVGMIGCNSAGDSGDVEAAEAAAAAAPKTAAELSPDMPPEARRTAEAAIQQNNAQKAQMDAQAEAMKRARANAR